MNSTNAAPSSYTPLGDGHIADIVNGSSSGSADDSDTSSSQGLFSLFI